VANEKRDDLVTGISSKQILVSEIDGGRDLISASDEPSKRSFAASDDARRTMTQRCLLVTSRPLQVCDNDPNPANSRRRTCRRNIGGVGFADRRHAAGSRSKATIHHG
jgi:hypothetical protein